MQRSLAPMVRAWLFRGLGHLDSVRIHRDAARFHSDKMGLFAVSNAASPPVGARSELFLGQGAYVDVQAGAASEF